MAKYRIKIEALDPEEELRAEYRIGIECNGFVILADCDDRAIDTSIHQVSVMRLAEMIESNKHICAAAFIAKGIAEGRMYKETMNRKEVFEELAEKLGPVVDA